MANSDIALPDTSGDRRFQRVRTFVIDLAEKVGDLGEEQQAFVRSEDFEDLLVETTQRVWSERSEEKRRIYRDFLNVAVLHPAAEPYDERLRFLRTLEEMQEVHIELLRALLQEPDPHPTLHMGSMSQVLLARLGWGDAQDARARLTGLVQQLSTLRIIDSGPLSALSTGAGAEATSAIVTPFGQRFTRFLSYDN